MVEGDSAGPRNRSGARPNAVVISVLRAMPSMSICASAGETLLKPDGGSADNH